MALDSGVRTLVTACAMDHPASYYGDGFVDEYADIVLGGQP